MKSKNPLKSDSRKKIIKVEIDGENFYVTSIDRTFNTASIVRISGDPQRAKKLVKELTIEQHIKSIDNFYENKIKNLNVKMDLFKLNKEYLSIIPDKAKKIIQQRIEYYENLILWEDDNFDVKDAFAKKDWKELRKLKTKLILLFEKEQEYNKIKNFNLILYSTFSISVVDAKYEVRAEKLRRIEKVKD